MVIEITTYNVNFWFAASTDLNITYNIVFSYFILLLMFITYCDVSPK